MRSDRMLLCADCAVRFCVAPCPRCGQDAARDGRLSTDDRDALAALRRGERRRAWRAHWRRVRSASLRFLPAMPVGIAVSSLFWCPGVMIASKDEYASDATIMVIAGVAMMVAPLLLFLLWPYPMLGPEGRAKARAEERARRERDVPAVEAVDPLTGPAHASTSCTGVAEGVETLVAPISGSPCLAWRLVGSGPAGAIDDSDFVPFELVSNEGRIRVSGDAAAIDLQASRGSHTKLTTAALEELERRWTFPRHGRVRVREGILRSGDRVEVQGARVEELQTEGYRGQTARLALRDAGDVTLVIRSRSSSGV